MYEVPGTEWQYKSWPKPPLNVNSFEILPKVIKYKLSNTNLQTKIYKANIKNKNKIKEEGIWISNSDLKSLPISVLTKKIINYCMYEM